MSQSPGTSTSTPTIVESAAPDWKPKRAIAVATASSKKLLAPINADQEARSLPRTMRNFRRGKSGADLCKSTCISRKRRETPNPHYLPGVGERSSDIATAFHPSGDGSPGARRTRRRTARSSPRSPSAARSVARHVNPTHYSRPSITRISSSESPKW
jgi:hypothetical protein